jgi:hypothetical protein
MNYVTYHIAVCTICLLHRCFIDAVLEGKNKGSLRRASEERPK